MTDVDSTSRAQPEVTARNKDAASRAALLIVAAGVGVTLVGVFPLAAGLLAAPCLAVICMPLQTRLARHMSANVAALLIVIVVWAAFIVPGAWLGALAIQQIPAALRAVQQSAAQLRTVAPPIPGANVDSLTVRLGSASIGWVSTAIGPALGSIVHGIVDLSIGLLGLYFLLVGGDAAWRAVRPRLPFSPEGSEELGHVFVSVTRATLLGTLTSAALQGFSIGVGLRVSGNAAPAFWGIVAGFATLVPVVGNALIWVPAVVVLLMQRHVGAAVLMLVFGKVIPSLIDRIVRTSISRRVGNTHPMVTLLGALAGVRLVGPVGVLIGPTIVQCSLALIGLYDREYGLPWTSSNAEQTASVTRT
jgi:predicted PurR-regulated permease PerM